VPLTVPPPLDQVTVPPGGLVGAVSVSVTVAWQVIGWLRSNGGVQLTEVLVVRGEMFRVTMLELVWYVPLPLYVA
jgi:hypothetical protein